VLFKKDGAYNHVYKNSRIKKYLFKNSSEDEIFIKIKKFCDSNYNNLNKESLKIVQKYNWQNLANSVIEILKTHKKLKKNL